MNKITFFHPPGQDTFIKPIVAALKRDGEFEIDTFSSGDEQQYFRTMHSSDIAWFEWANDQVIRVSQHNSTKHLKQVVRLHSYEFFDGMHLRINWSKFDKLILVNDSLKELIWNGIPNMIQGIPKQYLPEEKINVIYNGVDTNKYIVPDDKKFNKKIAFIGLINFKKSPEMLIHCFNAIHKYDPEYEFHIGGVFQDPRAVLYFKNIEEYLDFPIIFDGYIKDVNKYLEDKDFVISTSIFESFHYSIMEGMSSGVVPLVHNWYGSDNVYHRENIFSTTDECVKIIDNFSQKKDNEKKESYKQMHDYVVNNFSLDNQIEDIKRLFRNLLQE